jgi:hypothetical protein
MTNAGARPMPLSDHEREKIRDAEVLKDEIRKEFQHQQPTSRLSDFQKQALLLLIGFCLTTLAGGLLTAWWKSRESSNQRAYLAQQRALEKTYAIIDRTAKEVAVTIAAADDVLATYYGDDWSPKEIEEREDNWARTSRNWRINSEVLSAELAALFPAKDIEQLFQEIIQKRKLLGNIVVNLPRRNRKLLSEKEFQALKVNLENANKLKLGIVDLLHRCASAMNAQTRQVATQ